LYSKNQLKNAKSGMIINGVEFQEHDCFTVLFRNEIPPFDNNCWFICLDSHQLTEVANNGTAAFLKLYEYGRKLKDAIEVEESASVLFRPKRYLNAEEFKILADEIAEHDKAYKTVSRSNGSEIVEILDDYDATEC
jgi:hypothetical protein